MNTINKVIFLSGSRSIVDIGDTAREYIDSEMRTGAHFLIGDADGADRLFQDELLKRSYENVQVVSIKGRIRNNLGKWETILVEPGQNKYDYYVQKDIYMTCHSTESYCLWDGISNGAKGNILRAVEYGKKCTVSNGKENWEVNLKEDIKSIRQRIQDSNKNTGQILIDFK